MVPNLAHPELRLDTASIRRQFPALAARPGVAYLDSASTTQKPDRVIAAVQGWLSGAAANPGRGAYPWSTGATAALERSRERFARFVGAAGPDEIVFTAGATAGLNAVAFAWGLANLRDGDEILFNPLDHATNVYPWLHLRQLLARFGVAVRLVPYTMTGAGEADTADILAKAGPRTRLVTTSHLHNVYGSLTTLEELHGRLDPSVLLCFDCSQSAGHLPVDVAALRADFAVFAGHKMFATPGTGVLYTNRRVHAVLRPFLPGGYTGVRLDGAELVGTGMPGLLEGGTQDLPGILALEAAIDVIDAIGIDAIAAHHHALTRYLVDRLLAIPGVRPLPGVATAACDVGYGIMSFTVDGVSAADVGFVLADDDIYLRTGNHCLPDTDADSVRVSLHVYNSADEIDRLVDRVAVIAKEAA